MKERSRAPGRIERLLLLCALAAALGACARSEAASDGVVAQAGDLSLDVDSATSLLLIAPRSRGDTLEVQALADLWTDYALLATAAAASDTALSAFRIEQYIVPEREQAVAVKLRSVAVPGRAVFEAVQKAERENRGGDRDEERPRNAADAFDRRIAEEKREMDEDRALRIAESAYIDSLEGGANVRLASGSIARARQIASSTAAPAVDDTLATFRDGAVTAREFAALLALQPPLTRRALAAGSDADVESVVRQSARRALVVGLARQRGVSLTALEDDSLRTAAARAVRDALTATGFMSLAGTSPDRATLERRVMASVRDIIGRRARVVPLGRLAAHLRTLYPNTIHAASFTPVADAVRSRRAVSPAGSTP